MDGNRGALFFFFTYLDWTEVSVDCSGLCFLTRFTVTGGNLIIFLDYILWAAIGGKGEGSAWASSSSYICNKHMQTTWRTPHTLMHPGGNRFYAALPPGAPKKRPRIKNFSILFPYAMHVKATLVLQSVKWLSLWTSHRHHKHIAHSRDGRMHLYMYCVCT